MLKYLIRYKFSLLLGLIVVLLSLLPAGSLPDPPIVNLPFLDKIVHLGMYGSLGLTAMLELRCKSSCLKPCLIMLILLFFMRFLIEVLQTYLIPSRSGEWLDLAANFLGLCGAVVACLVIRKWVFRS